MSADETPIQKANMALLQNNNGLGMMDLDSLLTFPKKKPSMVPICPAIVGCNTMITFSE